MRRLLAISTILAAAMSSSITTAQSRTEWPQLLGPRGDTTTTETLKGHTLTVGWRVPLDGGRSAVIARGDRVYTTGSDGTSEALIALDAATGREVWRATLGAAHATYEPLATPALVGDTVVALTATCVVHGVNANTGALIWQRSLVTDYKTRLAPRGCSTSPLIDNSTVVIATGAPATGTTIVGLHASTGEPAWTGTNLPLSLSTPVGVGQFGDERLLLYHYAKPPGTSGLAALRIKGSAPEVAWQIDMPSGMSDTAALALPGNKVLVQTWNDSYLVDVSAAPSIKWSTKDLWALYPPPTHHNGALYGFGGNSTEFFSAVDIATGKTLWTERLYRGYTVNAGGTLVVLSESAGFLRLVSPDPTRYRQLSQLQVFRPGARTITPPTVAGGRIFVRNLEEVVMVEAR